MNTSPLSIAIVGAGIGGLAAAATLQRVGHAVEVFEQAHAFARVGAGIQQAPNAVKIHRALGLESRLLEKAFQARSSLNRQHDTGEVTWERLMGNDVVEKFDAPYLLMHRADLHDALRSAVHGDVVHLRKQLNGIDALSNGVTLSFTDGTTAVADMAIGADGVHSVVREALWGAEAPHFTGRVAYRTTYPAARLGSAVIDDSAKWWGPDRHIVIYYVNPRRDEIYFTTSTPEPDFHIESWSQKGDLEQLLAAYDGFHPQVRAVLQACPEVHKWALFERQPMSAWRQGRITLMGDACHPMTPYMAQGAATALEDAAILARCLDGIEVDGIEDALQRYEDARKPRTARIQTVSHLNDMDKIRREVDQTYGYDAWTADI